MNSKKHFISPSALGIFKDCPRCFYLDRNMKIIRPRGIFPSLPGGVDAVMKSYHDDMRATGGVVDGVNLFKDQGNLALWRNWRTGMKIETPDYVFVGAIDDLAIESDGTFSPYDFKSKGSEPEEDYPAKYYQTQMDSYALMLEHHGMRPSGKAYFRFVWPIYDQTRPDGISFGAKTLTLATDKKRAIDLLSNAVACLSSSKIPESGENCEHCLWVKKVKGVTK